MTEKNLDFPIKIVIAFYSIFPQHFYIFFVKSKLSSFCKCGLCKPDFSREIKYKMETCNRIFFVNSSQWFCKTISCFIVSVKSIWRIFHEMNDLPEFTMKMYPFFAMEIALQGKNSSYIFSNWSWDRLCFIFSLFWNASLQL